MSSKFYQKIILQNPKSIFIILILALLSFGYYSKDFRLDASSDTLLIEGDPDLKYLREVNETYGSKDFLVLTYTPVSSFTEKAGSSSYSNNGVVVQNESFGVARVTLTGSGTFEIQHQCETTKTTDGFGQPANGYASESIYTTVEIYKEA